jgi:hypothetical protein
MPTKALIFKGVPVPTVWDRLLGHPTDIFAEVAGPAFNLSLNRSLGRLLRGRGTAPELTAA